MLTTRTHNITALQLLELLEDAVSDPDVVLIAAPGLCRILQNAPGPALPALDKHDAITMLAYIVKKQQQLDQIKVGPANQSQAPLTVVGQSAIAMLALVKDLCL